jgi:hypothetical protein
VTACPYTTRRLWPSLLSVPYTPAMTPPGDTARNLALALDAFLAEHRGCWRVYGEGLESGQDGAALWVECPSRDVRLLIGLGR